jgi:hypothetical protein
MNKLSEVSGNLGAAYRIWKKSGKTKDALRAKFFEAATEEVANRGLQTRISHVYGPTEEEARSRSATYHPAWRVLEVEEAEGGFWRFFLEELPEFKTYTYLNKDDGYVYSRIVSSGGVHLDDERLQAEDPELYEAVTFEPEVKRELKSIDELTDEQIAQVQEYIYEGEPTVKLAAPREAKPEELDAD